MNGLATLLMALGGGSLLGSIITAVATFRVNRASSVKILAEAGEVSKRTALAEAEKALLFSDGRYAKLEQDYTRCSTRLDGVQGTLEALLEAVDAIFARVQPNNGHEVTVTVTGAEIGTVRSAVREARRHLN
jgi:GTP-sensing pleiotropic transcriptional regulator CodY